MKPLRHGRTVLLIIGALSLAAGALSSIGQPEQEFATAAVQPNQPVGVAKGINPGRVVWVHNSTAVNQNCVADSAADPWYARDNNNQTVIDQMVSTALQNLSGKTTDSAAWDAIFKFHNAAVGKGTVGYASGEKIFIKINATSAWNGNFNPADLTPNTTPPFAFVSETSVGPVLSMLRQLVNVVGVDPANIYVGDPLKHIYKHLYDVWHAEFPNVHYIDNGGYTQLGRENVVPSTTAIIHYSDKGQILMNPYASPVAPVIQDYLYTVSQNANYVINLPMLKGHMRAGMTLFAKNNFGSQTQVDASHLHNGLVAPNNWPDVTRGTYGLYRVQVNIMGHSMLGTKNLIYLADALWATDYELDVPQKWQMQPFFNSYMASILVSLDPVAIEGVGYDFLRSEFTAERVPASGTYVQMPAVNDYLRQAADPANWPVGILYDPDDTGTPISSLGTYENWNNAVAKQYSRNLSPTGTGVELVQFDQSLGAGSTVSQTVVPGATATFGVVATGPGPVTYQWQREASGTANWVNVSDNATYGGSGTATLTVKAVVTAMDGDSFRCVVNNGTGTATAAPATLAVDTSYTVVTLAGFAGVSGAADGSGGTARFANPSDVAVDTAGNVYIADTANHTVRRMTPAGAVSTLAGQAGLSGSSDGTTAARFNRPTGVAVNSAGNVYVADTNNNEIRKVTSTGAVTTLAGQAGASGSRDGTGTAASFNGPSGIVSDAAGNLYVADTLNHTIRMITPAGAVTTVAGAAGTSGYADGTGTAALFHGPQGLALDASGDLFVSDTNNNVIREMVVSTGVVSTLAGQAGATGSTDGASSLARFHFPSGVAVDAAGILYVADTDNHTLREIVPSGMVITLAGSAGFSGSSDGLGTAAAFAFPTGVTVNRSGNVYVADTNNDTIRLAVIPIAPAITQQPQGQTVSAGADVSFSVTATGKPAPTYQWYLNGQKISSAFSTATSSTLSLTSVVAADAGNYTVTVTNGSGSVTSNVATLTVSQPTPTTTIPQGGGGGGGAPSTWFCGALVLLAAGRLHRCR